MADKRIIDFSTLTDLEDDDLLLVGNSTDTYNVKAKTLKDLVSSIAEAAKEAADKAVAAYDGTANELAELATTVDTLSEADKSLTMTLEGKVDGAYVENGYLYLTSNGAVVAGPLGPFSGGGGSGGGSGNNATLTVTNNTGWLSKTVADGGSCILSLTWSSLEDEMETGAGTLKVTVNGMSKATLNVNQGAVTVDVSSYLSTGNNTVRVTVSDVYGNTRSVSFSITVVALVMASSFDSSAIYAAGESIAFAFTPTGSVSKTIHILMDDKEVYTTTTTVSGRQMSATLEGTTHGAHTIKAYFDATINEETVTSNVLLYEIVVVDSTSDVPIIASDFTTTTVEQYTTLNIPYTVYTPNSLTSQVVLCANNAQVASLTVDRTQQTWAYRPDSVGSLELKIVSGETSKTFALTVTESSIDIEAETDSLALYLTSYGRSNNEENPGVWSYEGIECQLDNFNFTSDGWVLDDDGITVLKVAGDARVTIPYQPFAKDFRGTGKTIEIEFATSNVLNYDSVILSCMSGGRGIEITSQKATLKSEQSEIFTQYKEDEHVRIAFVAEKRSKNRLLYIYINGIMSGAVQYPADDDFSQQTPVNISIGSNDCTIDLYTIRVYDNDLTRYQILNNWIADTQVAETMLERYNHNNVYDDYGSIVIANLPSDLPYMVLTAAELPQYKGDKKTISGYYVNPVDSSKSFTFENAEANVQGTSSQYYPRKNYKIKFKGGFTNNAGATSKTYALRDGAIPVNTFTFKADVASSEGCNNVELVRLYNDSCTYKTPAQEANSAVRQGIDGFPIVLFWNDGSNISFVGKYNFNNDKGTEDVFGFTEGDESWEILNNTSDRVLWKSADFSGTDWLNDFEGRYPEDNTDSTNLAAFAAWIASTDTTAATDNALASSVTYGSTTYTTDSAEYRLAKFKAELGDWAELDSVYFYYLFTELFLMVDSRAKNAFPSFLGDEVTA